MNRIRRLFRLLRWMVTLSGLVMITAVAVSLTSLPWGWYRWLALPGEPANPPPACIVMMGGGGIPSESGLTRSWKAAEAARLYPKAMVVVAMPMEEGEKPDHGIEHELKLRGVAASRLVRESKGRNTREQAVEVARLLEAKGLSTNAVIALVTSPEHMRRTWRSFEKAGMKRLIAVPSWSEELKADLSYDEGDLGGPSLVGSVGGSLMVRYRFWDNLLVLVKCTRESAGLVYYRVLGWI